MNIILIFFMVFFYAIQSFYTKKFTQNYTGKKSLASPVFTVFWGAFVAIITFTLTRFDYNISQTTFILGITTAVSLCAYNYFLIYCSSIGPYSILMVFSLAGGILVPAISSLIFFNGSISVGQLLSMLLIFIAIYLVSKKEESKKTSIKFIFSSIGLGLSNGIYCALFDFQQQLTGSSEKEEMIVTTFLFAAFFSCLFLFTKEKKNVLDCLNQSKTSGMYIILASVVSAAAINSMVYLLPYINTTVLFTVQHSGVMLLSVFFSCAFFKERLSTINILGCFLMCLGLIGTSIL